jgi:hypothetical protein
MTNCTECSCRVTARNSAATLFGAIGYNDVCGPCYDYWGWENTHADEGHDDLPINDEQRIGCLVCAKDADVAPFVTTLEPVATGRRNRSHAACTHPRTPAGRAACRTANV